MIIVTVTGIGMAIPMLDIIDMGTIIIGPIDTTTIGITMGITVDEDNQDAAILK